jgi:hypothetical protein
MTVQGVPHGKHPAKAVMGDLSGGSGGDLGRQLKNPHKRNILLV